MLGSAASEMVRLISREIIFQEFEPTLYDHDTSTSQTDRRTTCHGNTALRVASRGKNRQFCLPHSYSGKNLGCSLGSRSVMLRSAESEMVRLISREIIFQEFEPTLYDHDTSTSQTDGRTDERTDNMPWQYRATRSFAR